MPSRGGFGLVRIGVEGVRSPAPMALPDAVQYLRIWSRSVVSAPDWPLRAGVGDHHAVEVAVANSYRRLHRTRTATRLLELDLSCD